MTREREFTTSFSADFDTEYPDFTSGARPHFGFPLWLGAIPDVLPEAPPVPDRWTTLGGSSSPWQTATGRLHRFERIYEQPEAVFGQGINFSFKIRSQFPFKIQTGTQVHVTSTITSP